MKHTTDIKLFWAMIIISLLFSGCSGPQIMDGDVLPMGTGSALTIFQQAMAKVGGTKILSGPIPGGTGYLYIKAYQEWFGAVLLGVSGKCNEVCLQSILNLTGNAMTTATLEELVAQANKMGWQETDPLTLPLWMRTVASIARISYSAAQLGTGWIVIVPAGAFDMPDEMYAPMVDN